MTQIAVVVSNGKSDVNQELTIPNAEAAKAVGIEIYVVRMYCVLLIQHHPHTRTYITYYYDYTY